MNISFGSDGWVGSKNKQTDSLGNINAMVGESQKSDVHNLLFCFTPSEILLYSYVK